MTKCRSCGTEVGIISKSVGLCKECIVKSNECNHVIVARSNARRRYGLPISPPTGGQRCGRCVNDCRIPDGEKGYCGVRQNISGKIQNVAGDHALAIAYYDPLPTNCVASWVCPGGTGSGFPRYSYKRGAETGYKNLAVFYGACTFDCLFCQNWHYKELCQSSSPRLDAKELASMVDVRTSCICFFGGDPTPFIDHSISTARYALADTNHILRICWESNGSMEVSYAKEIGLIALETGGCVKIDLKAWNEKLHRILCGTTNEWTLRNIELLSHMASSRKDVPLLVVSTPLIPGYIDEKEVSAIASFLADLDPDTPYSLLAFHPNYLMSDLPTTSNEQAQRCLKAARDAGLRRVNIGNEWLLR